MKRAKLLELTASLPPGLIGMEACSGAHHCAREMNRQGHDMRLMPLSGIGPTTASALVVSIGDGNDFTSGRQLAAWLGMVAGQPAMRPHRLTTKKRAA